MLELENAKSWAPILIWYWDKKIILGQLDKCLVFELWKWPDFDYSDSHFFEKNVYKITHCALFYLFVPDK